ncbi:MAG: SGNH/GDSL hydrolase family protein [Kiritimatiellae bacterium]|nr:SGNH/GDSL hydrolase family protein [Kiritimatiellia bacterium]MDD5522053.1 SGNH/GDSL hydrolase family protein [Kiritimatiellia bacterium]
MISRLKSIIISLFILTVTLTVNAADFFFKDGDKVMLMGDSITEQYLYSSYVEAWTLARFPAWNITFINVGIGGDRSTGGNNRFKRDVLPHTPTAMTVDFGMNDGGYRPFDETGFKTYMGGLQGIADQAKAANIRVAWCTPSPVEKNELGPAIQGYNETLEKYSEGVKQIAAANNGIFIDQFHPFIAIIDKGRAADPKNRIGGGDAVHPGPPGQAIMAWSILKGMNFPPLVASVEIDAAGDKVTKSQNCKIENLKVNADGKIEFKQQDAALPFFPEEAKSILQWAPIMEELNDYRLKVTGLKAGQYEIRLGGKKIAEYSAVALNDSVNLAPAVLSDGPIADHVKAVWAAVKAKNDYYHQQIFRGVVLAEVKIPDFLDVKIDNIEAKRAAALKIRMARMPELFDAIKKTLIMQPHQVEIIPVPKQ